MAFGDTSLLKGLGASPKPGQVRALLDSIYEDVEAFSTVAYESARRWPRIALAVLLPRADDDTLDRLLSHADLALEKQTPMPSKMVFVREPLHLRAVSDGKELIVDGPAPTDLMEMVLAAAESRTAPRSRPAHAASDLVRRVVPDIDPRDRRVCGRTGNNEDRRYRRCLLSHPRTTSLPARRLATWPSRPRRAVALRSFNSLASSSKRTPPPSGPRIGNEVPHSATGSRGLSICFA